MMKPINPGTGPARNYVDGCHANKDAHASEQDTGGRLGTPGVGEEVAGDA